MRQEELTRTSVQSGSGRLHSARGDQRPKDSASSRSIAYVTKSTGVTIPEEEIEESAKHVRAWAMTPSILGQVVEGLSSGGLLYNSDVTAKLLAAFVAHGGGDEVAFVAAAKARSMKEAGGGDAKGLSLLGGFK